MAEIILAILCIIFGVVCALLTLLSLWAGALEQAATGSSDGGMALWALWFFLGAVAGIGGGIAILVL